MLLFYLRLHLLGRSQKGVEPNGGKGMGGAVSLSARLSGCGTALLQQGRHQAWKLVWYGWTCVYISDWTRHEVVTIVVFGDTGYGRQRTNAISDITYYCYKDAFFLTFYLLSIFFLLLLLCFSVCTQISLMCA